MIDAERRKKREYGDITRSYKFHLFYSLWEPNPREQSKILPPFGILTVLQEKKYIHIYIYICFEFLIGTRYYTHDVVFV